MRTAIIILTAVLAISMPTPSYSQNNIPDLDEILDTFDNLTDDEKINCILMTINKYYIASPQMWPKLVELLYDENPDIREASNLSFNLSLGTAVAKLRYRIEQLKNNDPSQRYHAAERISDFMSLGILALPALRVVYENDCNGEVRRAAKRSIRTIRRHADESGPVLIAILEFANPHLGYLRDLAVIASVEVEPTEELVEALCNTINEGSRMQRLDIIESLGEIGIATPDVLSILMEALGDEKDWFARFCAANALGNFGPDAMDAVPQLSLLLMDEDEDVIAAAEGALEKIGGDPVPHLTALLGIYKPDRMFDTARTLARIGEPAVPALIDILNEEENINRRTEAILALMFMGAEAYDAVPTLIDIMNEKEQVLRSHAIHALGSIGLAANDAVPYLIEALKDEEINIAMSAARALGRIGPSAREAIPALIKAVQEPDPLILPTSPYYREDEESRFLKPSLRRNAIFALGQIGRHPDEVIPILFEVLHDEDESLTFAAIYAISKFGEDAVPLLIDEFHNGELEIQQCVVRCFSYMGSEAKEAIPFIHELLSNADLEIRKSAVLVMRNMGSAAESALPKLRQMAETETKDSIIKRISQAIEWIESDWTFEKQREKRRNSPLCPG